MDDALVKVRHERSVKDFPNIRLDDDEYVEFAFSEIFYTLFMAIFYVPAFPTRAGWDVIFL